MGLYDIDIEGCGFDRIGQIADMMISVSANKPGVGPFYVTHQAKGRGLRTPVKMSFEFKLTYKRRHKRQTRKDFPFSVIVQYEPKGFSAAAKQWCIESFGERNWDTGWVGLQYVYFFKQKSHAVMFMLMFKNWQP